MRSLSHFVALYWIPAGCVIAEVEGAAVSQFGPFAGDTLPLTLAASMFPELTTVELPAQAAMLDDEAVLILGNRVRQRPRAGTE